MCYAIIMLAMLVANAETGQPEWHVEIHTNIIESRDWPTVRLSIYQAATNYHVVYADCKQIA